MLTAYMALIDSKPLRKKFERFYHGNRLLGMSKAFSVLHDSQKAEDALSESFFRLAKCFQKVHNLPSHKLQSYFVIIVRNVSLDMLRKETRVETVEFSDELDYGSNDFPEADSGRLAECIERLSDTDREILYLRYDLQLDSKDIAEALDVTEAAARQRLSYARGKLRSMLEKE